MAEGGVSQVIRRPRKRLQRCNQTGWVIILTELDAKIVLAQRIHRDKGETRYYQCRFGNHFHLTSEPENETTSEALTSRVAV